MFIIVGLMKGDTRSFTIAQVALALQFSIRRKLAACIIAIVSFGGLINPTALDEAVKPPMRT